MGKSQILKVLKRQYVELGAMIDELEAEQPVKETKGKVSKEERMNLLRRSYATGKWKRSEILKTANT